MSIFSNCKCPTEDLMQEVKELRSSLSAIRHDCHSHIGSWGSMVTGLNDRVHRMEVELKMDTKYCLSCKKDFHR